MVGEVQGYAAKFCAAVICFSAHKFRMDVVIDIQRKFSNPVSYAHRIALRISITVCVRKLNSEVERAYFFGYAANDAF